MSKSLLILLLGLGFSLSSCTSKVDDSLIEQDSQLAVAGCKGAECAVCELPWGGTLGAGLSTTAAFSKDLVECNENCSSFNVKLTCKDGQLTGVDSAGQPLTSFAKITNACYKKRCDCNHASTTVEDGKTANFYRAALASCGARCEPRSFDCKSGLLIDTDVPQGPSTISNFIAASCTEVPCQACTTPWGSSVPHLGTTTAYSAQVAPCGKAISTISVQLTCNNGTLSGGNTAIYKYGSSTTRNCDNCRLGSGDLVAHGSSITAFKTNQSECETTCAAQSAVLTCTDGVLTGGSGTLYAHTSCAPKACRNCTLPCGQIVASAGFGYCYKANKPSACGMTCLPERKKFNCTDGTLTGEDNSPASANTNFSFNTCSEEAACSACTLPDGKQILDGKKTTLFKESTLECGKSCFATSNAITLTCSNGVFANAALYKDFKRTTCESVCKPVEGDKGIGRVGGDGGGAPTLWCQLPWGGGVVTHNTTVVAYSRAKAPAGQKCSAYKAMITCNAFRGLFTGGAKFVYGKCVE